jgi:hypothetical protein
MRFRSLRIGWLLFNGGCGVHAASVNPKQCDLLPPANSQQFTIASVDSLAGDFEMVQVTTNSSLISFERSQIHLYVNDSIRRVQFERPTIGHWPGIRPLAGWVVTSSGDSTWDRIVGSRDPNRPGIEWIGDRLFIGPIDGTDGFGDEFRVRAWSSTGFWGTWQYVPGIDIIVDSLGRELPPPLGYFCATRLSAGA